MALWPFGKKNEPVEEAPRETTDTTETFVPADEQVTEADTRSDTADSLQRDREVAGGVEKPAASIPHDAVSGESGPFDGDNVDIEEFDLSDYATGVLNLGSMRIPLPKGSQVQLEMGESGPRMLHIVTRFGRITPVAFAAPRQGGQWETASQEILEGMTRDGMPATFVEGVWGREVTGSSGDNTMRIIGIDGPRWMLRLTLASPKESAEQLTELARSLAARTFVYRGDDPVLAGDSLPVELPPPLVEQVQAAMAQRQEQARIQQESDQASTRRHDEQAVNDAAETLKNLGRNTGNTPAPDSDPTRK
ncbi:DUF3710 domain-containing protein [Corynebacterium doosanense]|uniref:DUF3710 domain-containing protein n=1 Tax=Corynebacterium doosanense CAU 212 = DSM 45436 TaxID=558173 RepID=A0A097IGJ4_9CORY|nr:DUF3710 domain-containing protein [Corynebacterium doosanense]AIT61261.1 hypothetical protein CDOO_08335 [Corynebacterium doosanense CAU 212 = DSM 45436]